MNRSRGSVGGNLAEGWLSKDGSLGRDIQRESH